MERRGFFAATAAAVSALGCKQAASQVAQSQTGELVEAMRSEAGDGGAPFELTIDNKIIRTDKFELLNTRLGTQIAFTSPVGELYASAGTMVSVGIHAGSDRYRCQARVLAVLGDDKCGRSCHVLASLGLCLQDEETA